jgi:hypothetical protein
MGVLLLVVLLVNEPPTVPGFVCLVCRQHPPDDWYARVGAVCLACIVDWWQHNKTPPDLIEGPVP